MSGRKFQLSFIKLMSGGNVEPPLRKMQLIAGPIRQAAGSNLDSVVVSQAYHVLHNQAELNVVRAALDDEEGTLGLIWHRPVESGAWLRAFTLAAEKNAGPRSLAARSDLINPLKPGQTPIAWIEALGATDAGFRPLRHRKFVERVTAPVAALLPILRLTHDARFPPTGDSPAFEAACAAALASPDCAGGTPVTLVMDLHSFVTTVPAVVKKSG